MDAIYALTTFAFKKKFKRFFQVVLFVFSGWFSKEANVAN